MSESSRLASVGCIFFTVLEVDGVLAPLDVDGIVVDADDDDA